MLQRNSSGMVSAPLGEGHRRGKSLSDPLFITTQKQEPQVPRLNLQRIACNCTGGGSTFGCIPTEKLCFEIDSSEVKSTLPAYQTSSKKRSRRYSEATDEDFTTGRQMIIDDSNSSTPSPRDVIRQMASPAQPYWEYDSSYTSSDPSDSLFYNTNRIQLELSDPSDLLAYTNSRINLELIKPQESAMNSTQRNYNPCQSYQSSVV